VLELFYMQFLACGDLFQRNKKRRKPFKIGKWDYKVKERIQIETVPICLSRRNRSQFTIPLISKFYNGNTQSSRNDNVH